MKPIEQLCKNLQAAHPTAALNLTRPVNDEGVFTLDVELGRKHLVVEWSLAAGFGISTLTYQSYGERPDESVRSIEDAQRRVDQLLAGNEETTPPWGVLISRLRETRGRTQQELANRLGIKQASVSGMERRDDFQISTLKRVIEGLGGVLEIFAVFSDARYRIDPNAIRTVGAGGVAKPAVLAPVIMPTEKFGAIFNEASFPALLESGDLPFATRKAEAICTRQTLIMIP